MATVLVADDDPSICELVEVCLERHRVVSAADGAEALNALASHAVDVIVLDIMMPKVDGIEVLRRIRTDSRHRDLPVVILTARVGEDDHLRGYQGGADGYLTKPFDPDDLASTIETVLARTPEERVRVRESEKERGGGGV
jgi:CheY-like chemotaxis protein